MCLGVPEDCLVQGINSHSYRFADHVAGVPFKVHENGFSAVCI